MQSNQKLFSLIFVYLCNAIEMRHQARKDIQIVCGGGGGGDGHYCTNQMAAGNA